MRDDSRTPMYETEPSGQQKTIEELFGPVETLTRKGLEEEADLLGFVVRYVGGKHVREINDRNIAAANAYCKMLAEDGQSEDNADYIPVDEGMIVSEEPANNSGVKTGQPRPYIKEVPEDMPLRGRR